jgi:ribosomal protein S18 acetylase RimI-like enzyme
VKTNFFLIIILLHGTLYPMHPSTEDRKMKEKPKIEYVVRKGRASDRDNLKALYIKVASIPGGLVRSADEITDHYIEGTLNSALERGLIFVAEYQGTLIGSVLKYKSNIKVLSHVLEDGSILVDPEYQGMGVGTKIYTTLLDEVKEHHPDVLRVELKVRVSNPAIRLYERLGFKKEGEFKDLIRGANGNLESVLAMTWFNPNFKD